MKGKPPMVLIAGPDNRVVILSCISELKRTPLIKDDIEIEIPKSGKSLTITHRRKHIPTLKLKWAKDHFIGYFLNAKGKRELAIVSIWDFNEAKNFNELYIQLTQLSARRPSPKYLLDLKDFHDSPNTAQH